MTDNDVTKLLIALRAADEMARICDDWVKRGIIDSRSALADARLNYGQPFEYEWSKPTAGIEQIAREWTVIGKSGHADHLFVYQLCDGLGNVIVESGGDLDLQVINQAHNAALRACQAAADAALKQAKEGE